MFFVSYFDPAATATITVTVFVSFIGAVIKPQVRF